LLPGRFAEETPTRPPLQTNSSPNRRLVPNDRIRQSTSWASQMRPPKRAGPNVAKYCLKTFQEATEANQSQRLAWVPTQMAGSRRRCGNINGLMVIGGWFFLLCTMQRGAIQR
jgi:hypothetical protein